MLAILAVVGLALTPVTASAGLGRMGVITVSASDQVTSEPGTRSDDMAGMAMDEMPCCPQDKPAMPDCGDGCPVMALCLAKLVSVVPTTAAVLARTAVTAGAAWTGSASYASQTRAPPPRPPQA
ncbi:hypothetical protein OCOJLMKI_1698 [Methylobacterium iners]|uniref:Uncharacterized protein n=2 Tax=Methylobacterium iners TaxID=418707 RepID=A0ABQ4RV92_9HYPH|nr:hypothetical protein OCOJLMKI_1698 [Methylobacterium iners]